MWHLFISSLLLCLIVVSSGQRIIYRGNGGYGYNRYFAPPKKPTKFKMVKVTSDMKQKFVDAHNDARRSVDPPAADMVAVKWDNRIAKISKKFVRKCQFMHSVGSERTLKGYDYPLGENLFVGMNSVADHNDPAYITSKWDEERDFYNFNDVSCQPGKMCGHYTQVVWSTTKKIGCAMAICPSVKGTSSSMLNLIVACHYGPNGNWRGEKPYKMGKSCSECPADTTTCSNNLCI